MNLLVIVLSFIVMLLATKSIDSYPLAIPSSLVTLPFSQIDHLCTYISRLQRPGGGEISETQLKEKRFAIPFPDMNRFLSTSHKLHHHHHHSASGTTSAPTKHDFHAYLCSISKDSEEMSNFINIFVEEHGQPPAFNLFESCEQVAKRDEDESNKSNEDLAIIRLNKISQYCSNRPALRIAKRWKDSVEGPISIDFINQMLESRKVKSYPYHAEMDPYLLGR